MYGICKMKHDESSFRISGTLCDSPVPELEFLEAVELE